MNTMNIPGFTAEDSLYQTSGRYQTGRQMINLPTEMIGAIYPAREVIVVRGCPPGSTMIGSGDDWYCFPDPLTEPGGVGGDGGGPGGPFGDEPNGGERGDGDGGGGGSGGSGGGTEAMDRACLTAASKCKITISIHKRCAFLRCQKNYCADDEEKCTADENEKSKEAEAEYNLVDCDLYPCPDRPKLSSFSNVLL